MIILTLNNIFKCKNSALVIRTWTLNTTERIAQEPSETAAFQIKFQNNSEHYTAVASCIFIQTEVNKTEKQLFTTDSFLLFVIWLIQLSFYLSRHIITTRCEEVARLPSYTVTQPFPQ